MISADGRYVAFSSSSHDLVPNANGDSDVFVRDLRTGKTSRASVSLTGGDPDAPSGGASISADGRYVAFSGESDGLVPNDHTGNPYTPDVFVRDIQNDTTVRASVDTGGGDPDYPAGFDGSSNAAISTAGRYVAFTSAATDLVAGDANGTNDVFVRDLQTATTKRVSVDRTGGDANSESWFSSRWSISGDGRFITFYSAASDLVAGDGGQHWDVFVRDMVAGKTTRVSETANHTDAQGTSDEASISGDGGYVAFASDANNLVPNDGTDASVDDLFIRDVRVPTLTAIAPSAVARGSTATLTLTGTGFVVGAGAPRAAFLGSGVTVSSATAVSETKIELTVSVATDAALGGRAVIVANRGTGPGPGAATYAACTCLTVA